MAKEMKSNFGPARSKPAGKAGSVIGKGKSSKLWQIKIFFVQSIGSGGVNWPCNEELAHNNITHPMSTPNNDSNNSSVQSNSNRLELYSK